MVVVKRENGGICGGGQNGGMAGCMGVVIGGMVGC